MSGSFTNISCEFFDQGATPKSFAAVASLSDTPNIAFDPCTIPYGITVNAAVAPAALDKAIPFIGFVLLK